jgi:hypothetical protein
MDPISLAVLAAIGLWILAAPDQSTASIRSGAAAAIGSGARAAVQSIRADVRSAANKRSTAHQDRVDRWKADAADSRSARLKLTLDRVFGRGGVVESAGRRIGAHGRAAAQAARVGWQSGRARGRKGIPDSLRRRLAPAVASARSAARTARGEAQPEAANTPADPSRSQAPDPSTTEGNSPVAQTAAQPINTEAGLLPVAEQIVAATAELAALIEAATASTNMAESLTFDPGDEVKASMSVLAESAPDADKLRAWGEAATGFKTSVEQQITALQGA